MSPRPHRFSQEHAALNLACMRLIGLLACFLQLDERFGEPADTHRNARITPCYRAGRERVE